MAVPAADEIEIRSYEPADRDACRVLWVELTQHHRDIYGAPTIGGDDPGAIFDEQLDKVGSGNLWVAVDGDRVVGLTGIQETGDLVEVEPVIVAASHRGRGIGRRLVEHVVAVARERQVPILSVRPVARNADAIAFFHGAGFTTLGHLELFMDLRPGRTWQDGETIAGQEFQV